MKFLKFLCTLFILSPLTAIRITGGLHSTAEIASEVRQAERGKPFHVAITITLEPHWHTYYKNPGDSGAPTTVKFSNTDIVKGELLYPAPEKITVPPLTSYGYHGKVTLLLPVTVAATGTDKTIILKGKLDYLECKEECLPAGGNFTLPIDVGNTVITDTAAQKLFAAARSALPAELPYTITASASGKDRFTVKLPLAPLEAYAIADPAGQADVANPEITIEKDTLVMSFREGKARSDSMLLSIRDNARWSHWKATLPQTDQSYPVLYFFLLALLGGILLNFMPCVLPVLSLKAVSLATSASARKSAWGYTTGVIATMAALGAVFLLMRATGAAVGWGFQLQSPFFVAAMVLLFFAIAANLLGAFEITAPVMRTSPVIGDFLTGVIAVVAATPCTAPFMATALGAALTLKPVAGFFLFVFLGAGMSLPFLLLAFFPCAGKVLPRPGAWLDTFKGVLGFMMAASALWLASVFHALTGEILPLLAAALLVVFALFVYGRQQRNAAKRTVRVLRFATIVSSLIAAVFFTYTAAGSRQAKTSTGSWQNFSPAARDAAIAEHRRVFIDFTADWCLTCKVNERIAFTEDVMALFRAKNVVLLKADFTARDALIASELAALGRAGVPVYVLYGKSGKREIWPEILSESFVSGKLQNLTE